MKFIFSISILALFIAGCNSVYYSKKGYKYLYSSNLEKAEKCFNKAIRINHNNSSAYNGRGIVYTKQNNIDKSLVDFDKAIELNPENSYFYSNKGLSFSFKKDCQKAINCYDHAIELYIANGDAYNNRAGCNYYLRQYRLAIDDYTLAIKYIDNNNPLGCGRECCFFYRAKSYGFLDIIDSAIHDYSLVLVYNPKNYDAFYERGRCYIKQNKANLSLNDFKVIEDVENYNYENRAYAKAFLGKLEQAIKIFTNGYSLKNTDFKTHGYYHYQICCFYAINNKTQEAISSLAQAIENGYNDMDWIEHDMDLNSLRKTLEYYELMKKMSK